MSTLHRSNIMNVAKSYANNERWLHAKLTRSLDNLLPCFAYFFKGKLFYDYKNYRLVGNTNAGLTATLQWIPESWDGNLSEHGSVRFTWIPAESAEKGNEE